MKRRNWCPSGKPRRTRGDAIYAARQISRDRLRDDGISAFPCPTCGWWHLTSQPQAKRRAS